MAKQRRRNYSNEFKEEAVKLVTDQGYQVAEAARNLGVNVNLLGLWRRKQSSLTIKLHHLEIWRPCKLNSNTLKKKTSSSRWSERY